MSVQEILANLGVETVGEAIAELDLAKDSLAKGWTNACDPWEKTVEEAMVRINGEIEMLVSVS